MTATTTSVAPAPTATIRTSRSWTLWGVAAGALGAVATIFTTVSTPGKEIGPAVLASLSPGAYHVGGAVGYLVVGCLLVLAGCWRANAARYAPDSAAARVVADALTASAAALTLGYGWKLALALYLPGGFNKGEFGTEGLFFYYMLNDFGAFLGWLGVVVAAAAVAWLGLRHKLVSTWLAVLSVIPPLAVLFMACGLTVAGYPGIVAPIWLLVAFVALALGKHRITGTR